jgi:hypothetical protein
MGVWVRAPPDAEENFMNDFDFAREGTRSEDLELFLGPLENQEINVFDENSNMSHIMFTAGIFPSVSQARKNGWNKPIPNGFSEFVVGKRKTKITILNIVE